MSAKDDSGDVAGWLANHPRMIGAMFTLLLLLSQAGGAAANLSTRTVGP